MCVCKQRLASSVFLVPLTFLPEVHLSGYIDWPFSLIQPASISHVEATDVYRCIHILMWVLEINSGQQACMASTYLSISNPVFFKSLKQKKMCQKKKKTKTTTTLISLLNFFPASLHSGRMKTIYHNSIRMSVHLIIFLPQLNF